MVAGYSAAQIRAVEAPHLKTGEPLMQRAASAVAAVVREMLESAGIDELDEARVLLLVGPGNNGGDALYAGAELAADGVVVTMLAGADRIHPEGLEAAMNAGVLRAEGVDDDEVVALALDSDVIVDGLLGTGAAADPALRGRARDLVLAIAPHLADDGAPAVVAVDLPSGVGADDGSVPDARAVLPADVTVTFIGMKAGLLLEPAASLAGRIVVADLGLGDEVAALEPRVTV